MDYCHQDITSRHPYHGGCADAEGASEGLGFDSEPSATASDTLGGRCAPWDPGVGEGALRI